jgi:hypothetical protein
VTAEPDRSAVARSWCFVRACFSVPCAYQSDA